MGKSLLKSLFLVLLSSFLGIMSNPEILTASDSVTIVDLDKSSIVKTVEKSEDEVPNKEPTVEEPTPKTTEVAKAEETPKVAKTPEVAKTPDVAKAPSAGAKTEQTPKTTTTVAKEIEKKPVTTVAPANNVKFAWGVQEVFRVETTAVNAGEKAALVGTLLYGHNYTSFGNITKLKLGDKFTVTVDGTTTTYKVVPNPLNNAAGVVLNKASNTTLSYGEDPRYSSITMNAFVNNGFGGHSLVLMTCYGSNGRYVVVADAI